MSGIADLSWFKSSYSGTEGDNCVEVAVTGQAVHIRDSKDEDGPHLTVGRDEWARFVRFAARG
ncbi:MULTISPECIES: DUF397 domain-containing protein [Streptomycetaceae]|uniref:DUF397 domain-containing protein n=1 Tax=Streptantibioticus cattleyicolor (strain ATCC 35852 / DSM 46488 / JCM 4925 / NBRC 14057 / NRRL 8057) TaxID=1003195 RepID=F8JRU0_STREN|nr:MULTISPECIES: DUF397 domain-containing protein [Streptomycetaceae]AEW97479.1 hypothetical protein SCATT_51080 [Streptantibioticus cattleyicolor NRRL 8057 = DSM 46488]MYS61914.1 DUF397 domain-containing protein [Streptomyces sp. SID5468]CCB77800.1 conserved protein of unknown function [Streptantibioticus cattleyicolor NRRL 8057 = DSM 46488]